LPKSALDKPASSVEEFWTRGARESHRIRQHSLVNFFAKSLKFCPLRLSKLTFSVLVQKLRETRLFAAGKPAQAHGDGPLFWRNVSEQSFRKLAAQSQRQTVGGRQRNLQGLACLRRHDATLPAPLRNSQCLFCLGHDAAPLLPLSLRLLEGTPQSAASQSL
jgi:hypothetical protein